MKMHHSFIERNFVLFKSICEWETNREQCLTEEDYTILKEFGLKEAALEGTPLWLVKWATYICRYIKFEEA